MDDPATSHYGEPQTFFSGGGGLVSTAQDYHRFCQMLLNGGELDGARLLGPKTIELMTMNHLPDGEDLSTRALGTFSETANDGVGFGLGFAMIVDYSADAECGVDWRVLLGRGGEHDFLGGSGGGADRDFSDAVHAVGDV